LRRNSQDKSDYKLRSVAGTVPDDCEKSVSVVHAVLEERGGAYHGFDGAASASEESATSVMRACIRRGGVLEGVESRTQARTVKQSENEKRMGDEVGEREE
jgi:hypothetical protein